jgi:hypothetical protein
MKRRKTGKQDNKKSGERKPQEHPARNWIVKMVESQDFIRWIRSNALTQLISK